MATFQSSLGVEGAENFFCAAHSHEVVRAQGAIAVHLELSEDFLNGIHGAWSGGLGKGPSNLRRQ